MSKNNLTVNESWEKLFEKYNILDQINKNGFCSIKASQIKEYKEPRLMAKWDSYEQLPKIFKENNINILPESRSSYVLGNFILYEELPSINEHIKNMTSVNVPVFESINVDNIFSESNAINILTISGILDDFLNVEKNTLTFNGRMGTGSFNFTVNTTNNVRALVNVNNAQCEIDGGFENDNSIVILEAKNVIHNDFHIRQLYYPYRLWINKVNKPIRLVFSVYSNKIFRLYEYTFEEIDNYSSLKLLNQKNYSLDDTTITNYDLEATFKNTSIKYNDNLIDSKVPFVQANNFNRVISLLENMYKHPMTDKEIAELMHFGSNKDQNGNEQYRQSQYYYNAGKYIGLFDKNKNKGKETTSHLTKLGENIFKMQYKERQLKLVSLILEHKIFNILFKKTLDSGILPTQSEITYLMRYLNVCGESQVNRRYSTVLSWISWIFALVE